MPQAPPDFASGIAGDGFHCGFRFLHEPAAAAKILFQGPVPGGFTANAFRQYRDFSQLQDKCVDLQQRTISYSQNVAGSGLADNVRMYVEQVREGE